MKIIDLKKEISELNNALFNASNMLENRDATIGIQTSEITDLKNNNIKLKYALNSARLEIRKLTEENILEKNNINFHVNTRYVRDNELSDISDGNIEQSNIHDNEEQQDQQHPGRNEELKYIKTEKPLGAPNMPNWRIKFFLEIIM